MWDQKTEARSCQDLVGEFRRKAAPGPCTKLSMLEAAHKDVYNICAPFVDEGETVIAGRVESRDEEIAEIVFFWERGSIWTPRPHTRRFAMQDPFVTRVHHQLVFGGVEVQTKEPGSKTILSWRTVFYRGTSIANLELLAVGPPGMKDIRLIQLRDGRIGLFTRPMRGVRPGADIGFRILDRLEDLGESAMLGADLLRGQFTENEWGGVAEAHALQNGAIGAVGHIAYKSADDLLHYYAYSFAMNPLTGATTAPKIIAERRNFPDGPAKRENLGDIVFSGGLRHRSHGRANLYVGVSDTEAYIINIPDPFLDDETLPMRA